LSARPFWPKLPFEPEINTGSSHAKMTARLASGTGPGGKGNHAPPPQEILEKIMNRKERKEKRIGGRRKGKEKKGRRKEKGRKKGRGWEGGRTYLVHDGKSHPHSKKREREFR